MDADCGKAVPAKCIAGQHEGHDLERWGAREREHQDEAVEQTCTKAEQQLHQADQAE